MVRVFDDTYLILSNDDINVKIKTTDLTATDFLNEVVKLMQMQGYHINSIHDALMNNVDELSEYINTVREKPLDEEDEIS